MKHLDNYISEQYIDEGLFRNLFSIATLSRMDSNDLLTGILDMYDYICDGDDMKKYFMDFPRMERPFWKNLYKLYSKGLFGIFDIDSKLIDQLKDEMYGEDKDKMQTKNNDFLVEVTPKLRRILRKVISESRVNRANPNYYDSDDDDEKLKARRDKKIKFKKRFFKESFEINEKSEDFVKTSPADPEYIAIFKDPIKDQHYVFSINKQTNLIKRIGNASSIEFLKLMISKLIQI